MFNLRMKDLFDLGSSMIAPQFTIAAIVVNVLAALFCGLFIYGVYKVTFSGVLFSKNMGITMIIIPVITSLIVMTISGNLALSLGMIGALSIIRFRTPVKDPRDTAFLFWAIAEGIICGVSAYPLAFISVTFVGLCLWILSKRLRWKSPFLLIVHAKRLEASAVAEILKRHCWRFQERSTTVTDEGSEMVYEVVLKSGVSQELLQSLKALRGVEKTVLVSYEGDLDEPR